MRFAIFSDVHGNLAALDVMLDDLANVGEVDQIWCLGDFVLLGPRPAQCIQRLRALHEQHGKEKVRFIGGNTDRYIVVGDRPGLGPPPTKPPMKCDANGIVCMKPSINGRTIN